MQYPVTFGFLSGWMRGRVEGDCLQLYIHSPKRASGQKNKKDSNKRNKQTEKHREQRNRLSVYQYVTRIKDATHSLKYEAGTVPCLSYRTFCQSQTVT